MNKKNNKNNKKRLGIIQSRGLGDIVIALPIARHYHNEGYEIHWPIDQQFVSSVSAVVNWVNWIPLEVDAKGRYFYDVPLERLRNLKCDEIIPLYQALSGHPEMSARPEFQITGFDQIKYHIAQVPFLKKWTLAESITRDPEREQALYDQVVNKEGTPYVVVHTQGSNYQADIKPEWIPEGWQVIEVTELTDSIFDWLKVIEGAEALIAVDSVVANLVDQLGITETVDCYWIARSHIHLTPVLGGSWTVLDPNPETLKRISVFKSS